MGWTSDSFPLSRYFHHSLFTHIPKIDPISGRLDISRILGFDLGIKLKKNQIKEEQDLNDRTSRLQIQPTQGDKLMNTFSEIMTN